MVGSMHRSESIRHAGACRIGGKEYGVRVWDMNNDHKFNTPSKVSVVKGEAFHAPSGDVVVFYEDTTFDPNKKAGVAFVDRCVVLNGKAYQLGISEDGKNLSAKPISVQMGQIQVPQNVWLANLVSDQFLFDIPESGKDPISLPRGRYAFQHFENRVVEELTEEESAKIPNQPKFMNSYIDGTAVSTKAGFDVEPGKVTEVKLGAPHRHGSRHARLPA